MSSQWMIIIAERGWVYVGKVARDGDQTVITDCYNVRRWGTTAGLGELAFEGPKSESLLDLYGTVRIHVLAVCGAIECEPKTWDTWLAKQQKAKRK